MFYKILIANIIGTTLNFSLLAQESLKSNDNIFISNNLKTLSDATLNITKNTVPFFDISDEKLYYKINFNEKLNNHKNSFLYLTIKKKTNFQFKLKPLYAKKINSNSFTNAVYIDSIEFQKERLASGNYEIILSLLNDSGKVIQFSKTPFQLLSNTIASANEYEYDKSTDKNNVAVENTFVAKYNLETIKRNILALRPISKGIEEKVIRDITSIDDLVYLKQFFYNFWSNRNTADPESEWKKYAAKLNEVAKKYGNGLQQGYETDRGRILLTFGEPYKQEKVPAENGALPYEIWFYKYIEAKNNISFLFYQPGMMGSQMYLLHSNLESEIINPHWKDALLTDPLNNDNKLKHRVFEYFK